MSKVINNVDCYVAKAAFNIVSNDKIADNLKNAENIVTKSLGTLQSQGIYACFLYLCSRKKNEKEYAEIVATELVKLMCELDKYLQSDLSPLQTLISTNGEESKSDKVMKCISIAFSNEKNILNNLDEMQFVKDIMEKALIYTRYSIKALNRDKSKSDRTLTEGIQNNE
ncbi:hypothetical protein [Calorimonas adulescens]|nr:hypothetical protein [Calorimonas adulescens]